MVWVPNRLLGVKVSINPKFAPEHIKPHIGRPQPPSFLIMKGKGKASSHPVEPAPPDDGTDNITGRYTIFDLEGIDNSAPVRRYTIAELAQRLLVLAIFETNSGVPSTICIECLRMALGERPCPHSHFPEDPRPCPKLVWPDEKERAEARGGTVSPIGTPGNSSQEYWRHFPASDFVTSEALGATPPAPSRVETHSHVASSPHPGSHRSRVVAPASPVADHPTGTTVNWFPCSFSHRHSSSDSAQRCNNAAMLNTFEHPPPAAVPASVERSMQIAMAMSGERREDEEDTWSTISRTSRHSASTSTARPSATTSTTRSLTSTSTVRPAAVRTSASSSSATRSRVAPHQSRGTSATARSVRYQPPSEVEEDEEGEDDEENELPTEHPLVPIPPGANPIPVESIHIDDDNPIPTVWYVVTTGSTVGVFDNLTVAQCAAQVSRGSWQRAGSRKAALDVFRRAVARNIVVVRS